MTILMLDYMNTFDKLGKNPDRPDARVLVETFYRAMLEAVPSGGPIECNYVCEPLGECIELVDTQAKGQGIAMLNQLESNPERVQLADIVEWVLDNWEALNVNNQPYRLLLTVARLRAGADESMEAWREYAAALASMALDG